jgi:hypothetical protein
MHNALLYQAYGGQDTVNECRYSLLKYLQAYNLTPPAHTALVVYTDMPDAFADFEPFLQRLSIRKLSRETVQRWKGSINFLQRVKIELMADFLQTFNGNVLYCDTDTYMTSAIEPLFEDIRRGDFYLHQYEGVIDKTYHPTLQRLESALTSTPLQYNNKLVEFNKKLKLFNTGVVGLNSSHRFLLQDVLALTDAVYAKFPKHVAEQFAFSYCLQKAGTVKTAGHLVAHYQNLKEFRHLLQKFFLTNAEESIPNLRKKLHTIDAKAIQEEKNAYESLSFFQKIGKRLSGKAWKIAQYEKRL